MRKKKEYKTISVSKEVHKRLCYEKDKFQKEIGGGSWSINDTISEIFKVLNNNLTDEEKRDLETKLGVDKQ